MQAQYGAGTIVDVNEHHTVIEFDEHGTRRFSTRIVVLESSNTPAPARKTRRHPHQIVSQCPFGN